MNTRPFKPLRRRLLLQQLVFGASIMALMIFGTFRLVNQMVELRLKERARSIADGILSTAECINENTELQRVVSTVAAEPGVELIIMVSGQEPRIIASSQHRWLGKKLSEIPFEEIGEDLKAALQSRSTTGGHWHLDTDLYDWTAFCRTTLPEDAKSKPADSAIMIHLTGAGIHAEVWRFILTFAACAIAALAMLQVLTYLGLTRGVLKPLARIRSQLHRLNADTGEIDIGRSRIDEIAVLAESLNHHARNRRVLDARNKAAADRIAGLLRELEDIRRALDEHSIIVITDANGVITRANDKFCHISGYSREELIGQTHRLINSGHHPQAFFKGLWSTISRGQVWKGIVKNRAKDGSFYWVNTTIYPVLDGAGKPAQYVTIRTDITALKRAEAALQQFKNTLDATRNAVFMFQPETLQYFYVNLGACVQVGYSKTELLGMHPYDLQPEYPEQKFRELIAPLVRGEQASLRFETVHRHKDGHTIQVENFLQYIAPEGEPARFVNIVTDITERHSMDWLLKQRLIERETLLQEVHHRVKNNLQVVTSLLTMQQQRCSSPSVAAEFQTSRDRIRAIALVHEQIYSSPELDRVELDKFIRELGMNILRGSGAADRVGFELHGKSFHLDLAKAVPSALLINELMTNALKHAFPDGRRGMIRVELNLDEAGKGHIFLRDDGVGMHPDSLKPAQNSSLGMRLINRLVSQLGGTLEQLQDGPGTGFHLTIPVSRS